MGHMKNITIYERGRIRVYINQCYRNFKWEKRKRITEQYAIRRDDKTGAAHYIGGISWSGRWRQYVFFPEEGTQWSKGCINNLANFLQLINTKHRKKLRLKRK